MALVNGADKDHIDLHSSAGGDVYRHMLKDNQARNDAGVLMNAGAYINYNYDTPANLAANSSATGATRLGVKRDRQYVILNGDTSISTNVAVKVRLNGSVTRVFKPTDVAEWSNGITLIEGHVYRAELKFLGGTASARPSVSVYKTGSNSTVTTVETTTSDYYSCTFTAEANSAYNIALYVNYGNTYSDAEYMVTLRDLTAMVDRSDFVSFRAAQTISDADKATARANIGAASAAENAVPSAALFDSMSKTLQSPTWSQGGLSSSDGSTTNNAKRIRSDIMRGSCDGLLVYVPSGMQVAAYAYVDTLTTASYVGLMRGLSDADANGAWYVPVTKGLAYALILGYANGNDIAPAAASNVQVYKCTGGMGEECAVGMAAGDTAAIDGTAFSLELGGLSSSTGATASNNYTIRTSGYIPVVTGRVFTYTGTYTAATVLYAYYYDANKNFMFRAPLVAYLDNEQINQPGVVPQGAAYVKFTYGNTTASGLTVTDGFDLVTALKMTLDNHSFRRWLDKVGFLGFGLKEGLWLNNGTFDTAASRTSLGAERLLELPIQAVVNVLINDPKWVYSIKQGDTADTLDFTDRLVNYSQFAVTKKYMAIMFYKMDDEGIGTVKLHAADYNGQIVMFATGYETQREAEIHDVPENIGVLNVINRAYQMAKLIYQPVENLPTQVNTTAYPHYIPEGTTIEGVMYSSVRDEGLYVPQCVSLDTYMTALLNPNSYIYTKTEPSPHYNALTYYGAVCSSFVAWCYGIDSVVPTTISFNTLDGMEVIENQSPYGLKLGDSLNKSNTGSDSGHIVIVTDIVRNSRGVIRHIEITEQTNINAHPMTRHRYLTPEQVQSTYFDGGYVAYRYHYIYKVPYTASPWINLDDETAEPATNLNLSPRRGDKANWRPGEDVVIDILDAGSYTNAKLYKGETLVSNSSISGSNVLTYTSLTYGSYSVYLTDGTNDSAAVYFDIIDTSETYTPIGDKQVTAAYSSENGTPASICFCEADSSDSDYKAVVAFHVLTDAEISAGSATVTAPNTGTYLMKTMYKTAFGLYSGDLTSVTVT